MMMIRSSRIGVLSFVLGPLLLLATDRTTLSGEPKRPEIRKIGTLDLDTEFLAEAVYDGSLASFLKGFFP
jgi:hypothetical protein